MSKLNVKRLSLSKKNSISKDSIIIPQIINNKFLNESSIIVNEIIEKIISLVISTNFNNNIEKKLSLSSYNFIKNSLDTYLSCNFITHDKDETYQDIFIDQKSEIIQEIEPISKINDIDGYNLNNNSRSKSYLKLDEQFYFNNYYHGDNEWDLMEEPQSNKFDRYAATMVKFKEIEKEKEKDKGFKYIKKNNGEVLEEVDEESEKNSINNNNNMNNEKSETNPSKIKEKKYNEIKRIIIFIKKLLDKTINITQN